MPSEAVSLVRVMFLGYFAYLSCIFCKITYIRIKDNISINYFKNFILNKCDTPIYYMIIYYGKCEIKYKQCKHILNKYLITPFQASNPTIHIIRDGEVVDSYHETDLEPLFTLEKSYDLIIHEISNMASENNDTIYMTRLDSLTKESINRNFKLSNIKFIYIYLDNGNESIPIEFLPHNNYYIVGNKLFDVSFMKWYCSSRHNITLNDNYQINILDHQANEIVINKNNYVIIGLNDYEVSSYSEDNTNIGEGETKHESDSEPEILERPTTPPTEQSNSGWFSFSLWGSKKRD